MTPERAVPLPGARSAPAGSALCPCRERALPAEAPVPGMAEAAPRRRLLPAWMRTAGDDGPAAVAPVPATRRRKAAARPRVAAVHCMNEAELVNVALAVLAEVSPDPDLEPRPWPWRGTGRKQGEKACSRREEEQELQPASGQAPGNTAGTGGGSDRSPTLPSPPGAGADAERTGWEDSQSDVLKYVREIFFS
uniref:Uncharacterized protein n=1 Tax=Melopsittacus undulatus TaxID=13146 RepID=A0A8V5FG12_MELUD